MNQVTPDCLVSGYEAHVPALSLPDADDRHVLAAAIASRTPLIVTFNLSDFPQARLEARGVRAVHPDPFLHGLLDEQPDLFLQAVRTHRASLLNPPKDAEGYVQTLRVNRLVRLALRLARHQSEI